MKAHESPRDDERNLVYRLRGIGNWTLHPLTTTLCEEAAKRIEALEKRVAQLEARAP
jgi:hypothetical protein